MTQNQMDFAVRSDIALIACLTDDELFNGKSMIRARKPVHVNSLLEANKIATEEYPGEFADDFEAIIDIYLGDHNVFWETVSGLIPVSRSYNRAGVSRLRKTYP